MSPNRRIFLNIVATYGRSLYALGCSGDDVSGGSPAVNMLKYTAKGWLL